MSDSHPSYDQLPCGVFITDKYGKIEYCNQKFLSYFGSSTASLAGKTLDSTMTAASKIMFQQIVLPSLLYEKSIEEIQLNLVDDEHNKIPTVLFSNQNNEGRFVWCSFIAEERNKLLSDLTDVNKELEKTNTELKTLSKTDFMTRCLNRREGLLRLTLIRSQSIERNSAVGILLLDLDNFKQINDRHGHHEGDEVLKRFSRLLIKNARNEDIVVRYGGEEFLLILPGNDATGVMQAAERIRFATQQLPTKEGKITVSIGAGVIACDVDMTNEKLIEVIDKALYHSKNTGRNKVTLTTVCVRE